MNPIPIITIWGILGVVIIAFVIYRFATDKPSGEKRHPLYPLASNPTDPTFPASKNKFEIFCYAALIIGLLGIILQLLKETNIIPVPTSALMVTQAFIPIGVICFAILKLAIKK